MEDRDAIGIVIALPLECRSLTRQKLKRLDTLQLSERCLIRVSGAGAADATAAANELVARGARRLVSWGCAGALGGDLMPGALVVPEAATSSDGSRAWFDPEWREQLTRGLEGKLRWHAGSIAESATIVDSAAAKKQLGERTGAVAVDMESAAVLRAASRQRLPCIAVRAIADDQTTVMPEVVLRALDEHGEVQLPALLSGLTRNPFRVVNLLRLNRCFNAALQSLTRVVQTVGPTLAA